MPEITMTQVREINGSSVYVKGNDAVILKDKTFDELNPTLRQSSKKCSGIKNTSFLIQGRSVPIPIAIDKLLVHDTPYSL